MTAVDLGADTAAIIAATGLLKRLGHPTRLTIVANLLEGEMSVAQMESDLGLNQPSLSQQLADLRGAGIIHARREAKTVFYRLADARTRQLVELIQRLFCGTDADATDASHNPQEKRRLPDARRKPFGAAVFARVGSMAEPKPPVGDIGGQSTRESIGRT